MTLFVDRAVQKAQIFPGGDRDGAKAREMRGDDDAVFLHTVRASPRDDERVHVRAGTAGDDVGGERFGNPLFAKAELGAQARSVPTQIKMESKTAGNENANDGRDNQGDFAAGTHVGMIASSLAECN